MTRTRLIIKWAAISAAVLLAALILLVTFAHLYPGLMLWMGLFFVVGGSAVSSGVAMAASFKAMQIKELKVSDFLPEESPRSATFLCTQGIMGEPPLTMQSLADQVSNLRKDMMRVKKDNEDTKAFTARRFEVLLAVLHHHREVVVPSTLASTAGWIYLSAFLAVVGSVLLAFPERSQDTLNGLGNSILYLVA